MRPTALVASAVLAAMPVLAFDGHDPARITPTFAWPPRLQAQVEIKQVVEKTGKPRVESTTRCKLDRRPHAEGLLISCRGASISPELPGEYSTVSDFLRIAAEFDWLVTARGEFVGLTNTDRMMAAFWLMPGPAKSTPAERRRVGPLSLAACETDARSTWSMLVENWADEALTLGEELSGTSDQEIPLAPGVFVRSHDTVRVERWLDCPGQLQTRCVEIRGRTVADPSDLSAALDRFFQKNATTPLGEEIREATFSREVTLVTDPATLVPYELAVRTESSTTPGDEKTSTQAVEKTWTFTYPGGRARPTEGAKRQ